MSKPQDHSQFTGDTQAVLPERIDALINPRGSDKAISGQDLLPQIYIEDAALFGLPNYLMFNKEELKEDNRERMTAKIMRNLTLPHPRFQDTFPQGFIGATLAAGLPTSTDARVADLMAEIEKIKTEEQSGIHPDELEEIDRYRKPYAALIKAWAEHPDMSEAEQEFWQNSAKLYLLAGEALKTQERHGGAASYVHSLGPADMIPAQLARKLNVTLRELTTTLREGGIEGFAERFDIPQEMVTEIDAVVATAAENQLSMNMIESWQAAQDIESVNGVSIDNMEDKLAFGTMMRAAMIGFMAPLAGATLGDALPPDVEQKQREIIKLLDQMPQELRDAIHLTGTEIGFVSAPHLGGVSPDLARARGVNHGVPYAPGNPYGFRRIMVSGMDNPASLANTLHHEVSHLLYPGLLSEEEITKIDDAYTSNVIRLRDLTAKLDAWNAASPKEQPAIEEEIRLQFEAHHISLDQAMAKGSPRAMSMETLREKAHEVLTELDPHSEGLTPGYPVPELRAAEVFARYGALEYASMRDDHTLLGYLAPDVQDAYHHVYLPHMANGNEMLRQDAKAQPDALKYLGLPPEFAIPKGHDAIPAPMASNEEKGAPASLIDAATAHNLLQMQAQGASLGTDAVALR